MHLARGKTCDQASFASCCLAACWLGEANVFILRRCTTCALQTFSKLLGDFLPLLINAGSRCFATTREVRVANLENLRGKFFCASCAVTWCPRCSFFAKWLCNFFKYAIPWRFLRTQKQMFSNYARVARCKFCTRWNRVFCAGNPLFAGTWR